MNPSDLKTLPDSQVAACAAGTRIRICVEYGSTIRSLLWFVVRKDGSLYTDVVADAPRIEHTFTPTYLPDGRCTFTWENAEPIDAAKWRPKISFHASGIIVSSIGRDVGVNLRLLTMRTLLCAYLPAHPDRWRPVEHTKRGGIIIHDLLQDDCPLSIELYY